MINPRNIKKPRWNWIDRVVKLADFTDGGATVGTYTLADLIPVGAITPMQSIVQVIAGAIGDTTAVLTIGDGSDVDRYNVGTPSIFSAGYPAMGIPSGTKEHVAAIAPVLTVTAGSDFTILLTSGGVLRVVLPYYEI